MLGESLLDDGSDRMLMSSVAGMQEDMNMTDVHWVSQFFVIPLRYSSVWILI